MPDAQPKPTAADVLREHEYTWHEGAAAGYRCPCGTWVGGSLWDHLADMLAAAGLLATAEHDAQVAAKALRDAATELDDYQTDTPTPSFDRMVRDWLRARADRIAAGETR